MIDHVRLSRVMKAVALSAFVVAALAIFVRVLYGGDQIPVSPMYGGAGMMGYSPSPMTWVTEENSGGSDGAAGKSVPLGEPEAVSSRMMAISADEAPASGDHTTTVSADRRVVRTGSLTLRVDDADWSVAEIGRVTSSLGGSVDASDITDNGRGVKRGSVTVRVPVEKFDAAMGQLKLAGRVTLNESVSGTDVTEQVIDLEARLKNKQSEETAYARILEGQTGKIDDVLAVTRAINQVRGEIESLQGRLKSLSSQADMSTISVFLSEDPEVGQTAVWRPWQVVKDAVNLLIVKLQGLADFFIRFVIVVLPTLVLFGLGVWIFYALGRWVYGKTRE